MLNVLITSGATREPIDDVRFVTNLSTGKTGALIAAALAHRGASVTLLHGEGALPPAEHGVASESFGSATDLEARIRAKLAAIRFDAVVMCAAVADYRPDQIFEGKLRSDAKHLLLRLVRTPKILPRIKRFAKPAPVIIGFKLTSTDDPTKRLEAVLAQFSAGGVDAVIQNDLGEIRTKPIHPFHLYRSPDQEPETIFGPSGLALALLPLIDRKRRAR